MAAATELQGRRALILYGSETGTAQDFAEDMGRIAQRLHFSTHISEMNDARVEDLLAYEVVLFAISTTGQGDFPANALVFSKRLRSRQLKSDILAGVTFASFGLGDSSYLQYNFAHRKLYNRFIQLGAIPLCDRGESDEQHPDGADGLFASWGITLKQGLTERFPLPPGRNAIPDNVFLPPSWIIVVHNENLRQREDGISPAPRKIPYSTDSGDHRLPLKDGFETELESNIRLTPESHWQDVRLLRFRSLSVNYEPGDVLTIFPQNMAEDVDQFIKLMEWESLAESHINFIPRDPKVLPEAYKSHPIPKLDPAVNLSLRQLLTSYLDINAVPRRSFFSTIAHFTEDETQKERLLEFSSLEYVDEYYDYATRPRRGVIEVLQEFDSVRIPLKWVASVIPKIRGRQFSIASGGGLKSTSSPTGTGSATHFELLVAIVKYKTVIKRIRQGLCTRYLASLETGTKLTVALAKGGMKIDMHRPWIMIGPGTGLAPLRSMIYERALASKTNKSIAYHSQLLFFGGRNRNADYFFEDEWQALKEQIPLEVYTAFSRDQKQKVYVQDIIRQKAKEVYPLLQMGSIYLCGSSGKMPQAVREALIEVVQSQGGISRPDAESFFVGLEKSGRYQQETW